jgi:hypothetical protein
MHGETSRRKGKDDWKTEKENRGDIGKIKIGWENYSWRKDE